jgi:hypothetical protein
METNKSPTESPNNIKTQPFGGHSHSNCFPIYTYNPINENIISSNSNNNFSYSFFQPNMNIQDNSEINKIILNNDNDYNHQCTNRLDFSSEMNQFKYNNNIHCKNKSSYNSLLTNNKSYILDNDPYIQNGIINNANQVQNNNMQMKNQGNGLLGNQQEVKFNRNSIKTKSLKDKNKTKFANISKIVSNVVIKKDIPPFTYASYEINFDNVRKVFII